MSDDAQLMDQEIRDILNRLELRIQQLEAERKPTSPDFLSKNNPRFQPVFLAKRTANTSSPYQFQQVYNSAGSIVDCTSGFKSNTSENANSLWPDDSAFRFIMMTFRQVDHVRYVMCPFLPSPSDATIPGIWVWDVANTKIKWLPVPDKSKNYSIRYNGTSENVEWRETKGCV